MSAQGEDQQQKKMQGNASASGKVATRRNSKYLPQSKPIITQIPTFGTKDKDTRVSCEKHWDTFFQEDIGSLEALEMDDMSMHSMKDLFDFSPKQ